MGHRDDLKSGDEWDIISRISRQLLTFTKRPGVCRAIKNAINRRERRRATQATVERLAEEYGMTESCIRQMLAIESGESTGDVIEVWPEQSDPPRDDTP